MVAVAVYCSRRLTNSDRSWSAPALRRFFKCATKRAKGCRTGKMLALMLQRFRANPPAGLFSKIIAVREAYFFSSTTSASIIGPSSFLPPSGCGPPALCPRTFATRLAALRAAGASFLGSPLCKAPVPPTAAASLSFSLERFDGCGIAAFQRLFHVRQSPSRTLAFTSPEILSALSFSIFSLR